MSDCPVCARAAIRNGSIASADACERQSKRRLVAVFKRAMDAFRTPEGFVPEWAALQAMEVLRGAFYMRGYTAGYKAGLRKGALQVPCGTSGDPVRGLHAGESQEAL